MAKLLIIYYSRTGNTEKMAHFVSEGATGVNGIEVEVKKVQDTRPEDLLTADGIIVGSPTYYGLPAAEIKALFDESVKYHGQLEGKAGGAFTSSGGVAGGNETTILATLQMLLVHGMIIQGNSQGDHYGPVSVGAPDDRSQQQCRSLGKRVAQLMIRLQ